MRAALATLMLLLAGCGPTTPMSDETSRPPLPDYPASGAASRVYNVDPSSSLLLVKTGRSGRASRFGHDHAIASETLAGVIEIHEEPDRSRADLAFAVRELIVDKPAYRERLALATQPSESDIAGTYTNMLKVLGPEEHAWVTLAVRPAEPGIFAVSATVRGTTAEFLVPVSLTEQDDRLSVSAELVVSHSDFALQPFSALGGLLGVADELAVTIELVAIRR
ncbi:MAG: hypothetical protein AAGI27_09045 [Pseudomonadota bacterium]